MDEPSEASQRPLLKNDSSGRHPSSPTLPRSDSGDKHHDKKRSSSSGRNQRLKDSATEQTEPIESIAKVSTRPAASADVTSPRSTVLRMAEVSAMLFETRTCNLKIDRGGKFVLQVREAPRNFAGPLGVWAGTVAPKILDEKVWARLQAFDGKEVPTIGDTKDALVETLTFTAVKGNVVASFASPSHTFPLCERELYKEERTRPWNALLDELRSLVHALRFCKVDKPPAGFTFMPVESWRLTLSGKDQTLKLALGGKATLSEVKIRTTPKQGAQSEVTYAFQSKRWLSDPQEKQLFGAEDGWSIDLPKASVPSPTDAANGATAQLVVWRRSDLCLTFDLPLSADHTKQAGCAYKK